MHFQTTAAFFAILAIHASSAAPLSHPPIAPLDAVLAAAGTPEFVAASDPATFVKRQEPVQPRPIAVSEDPVSAGLGSARIFGEEDISDPKYVSAQDSDATFVKRQDRPFDVSSERLTSSGLGRASNIDQEDIDSAPAYISAKDSDATFVKRQAPAALSQEQLDTIADFLAVRIASPNLPVAVTASTPIGNVAFNVHPDFDKREEPRQPVAASKDATFVKRQAAPLSSDQLEAIADFIAARIEGDNPLDKRQEPTQPWAVSDDATFVKRQEPRPWAVAEDGAAAKIIV